jgi:hypothetical protein
MKKQATVISIETTIRAYSPASDFIGYKYNGWAFQTRSWIYGAYGVHNYGYTISTFFK